MDNDGQKLCFCLMCGNSGVKRLVEDVSDSGCGVPEVCSCDKTLSGIFLPFGCERCRSGAVCRLSVGDMVRRVNIAKVLSIVFDTAAEEFAKDVLYDGDDDFTGHVTQCLKDVQSVLVGSIDLNATGWQLSADSVGSDGSTALVWPSPAWKYAVLGMFGYRSLEELLGNDGSKCGGRRYTILNWMVAGRSTGSD